MAREPMITARITKNKTLPMRVVMSSGCGLGASMAELDAEPGPDGYLLPEGCSNPLLPG